MYIKEIKFKYRQKCINYFYTVFHTKRKSDLLQKFFFFIIRENYIRRKEWNVFKIQKKKIPINSKLYTDTVGV